MSDYNLQISWSGKDALADSDPDKVVSGGDFNTEFLAVKTAVNSKACLLYTSPSPRDRQKSRMPSSA